MRASVAPEGRAAGGGTHGPLWFGDPLPPFALARLGTSRYHVAPRALSAVLSADGNTIAVGTEDYIILMDPKTRRERRRISDLEGRPFHVVVSVDGSLVGHSKSTNVWDTKSGACSPRSFGR
jgi:hypothetical protein